ncbi:MAG TPA: 4Fe-4S binding protein [Kofleriaceae bacterium]|jgi:ferredoxin|nr:4Fe-4S binding protein [Kofleriaceae bacterium]
MATMIDSDLCTGCAACVDECPNEAISRAPDGFAYQIAADRCSECVGFHAAEACQAVCPVECCLPDPAMRETEDALLAKAQRMNPHLADRLVLTPKTSRFRRA